MTEGWLSFQSIFNTRAQFCNKDSALVAIKGPDS